jgi:hypothetical protein
MSKQQKHSNRNQQAQTGRGKKQKSRNSGSDTSQSAKAHWQLFTETQCQLTKTASELDAMLKGCFGPEASISKLEKALSQVPSLPKEHQESFWLPDGVLALFEDYLTLREKRRVELDSFRTRKEVQTVATSLASVKALFTSRLEVEEEE